ncbi:MAG: thioredoxin family protein [Paludibacteraceae bacterium]|nr:thioredoxin family protein [Paludibacteraceae bacterium]
MKKISAFVFAIGLICLTLALLPHNNSHLGTYKFMRNGENHYVLINFWASYDAASREENIRFSEVLKKYDCEALGLSSVSVSLDDYDSLFNEVVKNDNLQFSRIYREKKGFSSELAKEFKLNHKFGNFLIDQNGKIIEKNITPEDLAKRLMKQ